MAEPPILSLREARVAFGERTLFDGVDVHLGAGERACLVGRNGSGKSTLMKTLMGRVDLDAGELYVEPGARVEMVEQEPRIPKAVTVRDYVAAEKHARHHVDAALSRLDLDGDRVLDTLSGGELRRAALARALADPPEVLLLDEPTNHLDIATIQWLEKELNAYKGAVLVVSHDRTFLANVTNRILWLERGVLRQTDRGFAHFEDWTQEVLEQEEREAAKLDTKLAQEKRWLLRGVTARRKRNQGRLRKLEEMRATRAQLLSGRGQIKAEVKDGEIRSRLVIEAKQISKRFGETAIVENFSTRVLRGDRIGVIGPNGAGKTTLIQLLTGELEPDEGSVRVGKHLSTAYFDQQRTALDPAATLQSTLAESGSDMVNVMGRQRHVRAYLKDWLFDPKRAGDYTTGLSGGERNRLLLAKLLSKPADLLILDEPTNDLDMDTLDLLEDLLSEYAGTLLVVSHDRDFLDRIVTSTIVMEGDGRAREYPGGYSDYLRQRSEGTRKRPAGTTKPRDSETRTETKTRTRTKLSYKDQRDWEELPGRIEGLKDKITKLEGLMADPGFYQRDPSGFEKAAQALENAKQALDEAETRWLELELEREALERAKTGSGG